MKQLIFMIAMTLLGTVGVYTISPFCGVAVYYLFAVLRPHYMWEWSLPAGVSWSYYVAISTLIAAGLNFNGFSPGHGAQGPAKRFSSVHKWTLLFAIWIGITYITAQNREVSYFWFVEYLKIFLMFGAAAVLVRTLDHVWRLMIIAALALAYIAYEVNFLYLVSGYLGIYKNGYGGFDNNGAGLMLAMAVPLCWFAYEGTAKWWRWAFLAFIPVIIHAVLMTYSRGAMVSLLAVTPFLLLRSRHRFQLTLAVGVLGLVLLPIMAGPAIRARFLTLEQHDIDESANSRRAAWQAAWRIALDYPVFGAGIRNANLLSHRYGADMEGRTIHSQYMQVLADNGFIGLGLYLAVLGGGWFALRRTRRLMAGREDAEANRVLAIANGLQCSLLVYCVGAAFISLEVFELSFLLLLLCGQLEVVSSAAAHKHDISEDLDSDEAPLPYESITSASY